LFPVNPDPKNTKEAFEEFFKERDEEEIYSLLEDLGNSSDSADALEKVFFPVFGHIYNENIGTVEKPVNVSWVIYYFNII